MITLIVKIILKDPMCLEWMEETDKDMNTLLNKMGIKFLVVRNLGMLINIIYPNDFKSVDPVNSIFSILSERI